MVVASNTPDRAVSDKDPAPAAPPVVNGPEYGHTDRLAITVAMADMRPRADDDGAARECIRARRRGGDCGGSGQRKTGGGDERFERIFHGPVPFPVQSSCSIPDSVGSGRHDRLKEARKQNQPILDWFRPIFAIHYHSGREPLIACYRPR